MPLADNDPVKQALVSIPTHLLEIALPIADTLTNGHAERELKFLLAAAIGAPNPPHPASRTHICLMDKETAGPRLDLVALTRAPDNPTAAVPVYWMEIKCTFAQLASQNAAFNLAKSTLNQIGKYFELIYAFDPDADVHQAERIAFKNSLLQSTAYIVHFISSIPPNADNVFPLFYYEDRFVPQANPLTIECLHHAYIQAEHAFDPKMFAREFVEDTVPLRRLQYAESDVVTLTHIPSIEAVIIKLQYQDVPHRLRMDIDDLL